MINCHIAAIAFGGEGIARVAGLVVFIPFTLPEEEVECSLYEKKSRFARANLVRVLTSSLHRITPSCPHFSVCGGCQLQHADYQLQLGLKQRFVSDALQRIGKVFYNVPPVYPSSSMFSYRKHISLKLLKQKERWQLCFSASNGTPLTIYSCLLFHVQGDPILANLQEVCAKLNPEKNFEGRIKLFKHNNTYTAAFHFSIPLSQKEKQNVKDLFSPYLSTLYFEDAKQEVLTFSCLGLRIRFSPFSFLQNHQEQSEHIYQLAVNLLRYGKKILDLYCGIGISSLLLAREGKEVVGIEVNSYAVTLAKENAKENGLNSVSFQLSTAEMATYKTLASFSPDSVLVNPPKGGLTVKVQKALVAFPSIQQIVYISCHPPTLARDLAFFQEKGFILDYLQPFDMFPQTTHVETVVCLKKQQFLDKKI